MALRNALDELSINRSWAFYLECIGQITMDIFVVEFAAYNLHHSLPFWSQVMADPVQEFAVPGETAVLGGLHPCVQSSRGQKLRRVVSPLFTNQDQSGTFLTCYKTVPGS